MVLEGFAYRMIMRLAHRFDWHYAPPCYPDGDTHLWCRWCGFRQTIKRGCYRSPQWEANDGDTVTVVGDETVYVVSHHKDGTLILTPRGMESLYG